MILAAGRGKRMGALTQSRPKPLLEVAGRPLIVWQLEHLRRLGIRDVVINLAYKGDMIAAALGDGAALGLNIVYSREADGGLETAGGIIQALPLLGDAPFLVLNADIFHQLDLRAFLASAPASSLAHLLLIDTPAWKKTGDFALHGQTVCAGETLTFAGISLLQPALFAGLAPAVLPLAPILRAHMPQGVITGVHFAGAAWQDVGTPERLEDVQHQQQN